MGRKGKWTRGPVAVGGAGPVNMGERGETYNVIHADCDWWYGMHHKEEDAELFAFAINAATACEDMGYDGEECVKALPELVAELAEYWGSIGHSVTCDSFMSREKICTCGADKDYERIDALLAKFRG